MALQRWTVGRQAGRWWFGVTVALSTSLVAGCDRDATGPATPAPPPAPASAPDSASASASASAVASASAPASGSAPPAFAPESRRDWHQLEPPKLEAQRAKCGPAVDDPELFAYQVVTGECNRDPLASTRRLGRVTVDRVEVRGEGRVVVITLSSLEDDSVRDERRRLELARAAGDAGRGWTITWAGALYRCWPGRGHQDFAKDFCI